MTAMTEPKTTKIQSTIFSVIDNLGPNSFKCAAAGKIQLTAIVQIIPTREHKKLKEGINMATSKAKTINTNFIIEEAVSMVRVNFENAVSIMSHVSIFIAR